MNYKLTAPCGNCPFRREGGVRLTAPRIREIAGGMLGNPGAEFVCHKTSIVVEGEDGEETRAPGPTSSHCAGALIFAEKNGTATQMMRICERLGDYDPEALTGADLVFDDLDEMLEAAISPARQGRWR